MTSRNYGDSSTHLRSALAEVIKKQCKEEINNESLEVLLACRLIPLDKRPGLRPIGVGEVLRRISGKLVMSVVKNDVIDSSGTIQMCSGQSAGAKLRFTQCRNVLRMSNLRQFFL